jgi:hypothetical protein
MERSPPATIQTNFLGHVIGPVEKGKGSAFHYFPNSRIAAVVQPKLMPFVSCPRFGCNRNLEVCFSIAAPAL